MATTSGYFRNSDNLKLYYSLRGKEGAPTLFFLYGLVCSEHQWKYQIQHFEKDYRILVMDYRAHNRSETPKEINELNLENLSKDVAELLTKLGLGPVPVFGHSLGVNVALELYHHFPEKVSHLILAHGTPRNPLEYMFQHNFLQPVFSVLQKLQKNTPQLLRKFLLTQSTNSVNQELFSTLGFSRKHAKREDVNEYLRIAGKNDTGAFVQLLSDFTHYNACHWLETIKVPSLIIGAEKDYITPLRSQKILHTLIPNSELFVLKKGSHNSQMEFVPEVNKRIEKFFKKRSIKNRTPSKRKKKRTRS